jgi:hypothetical protein
MDPLEELLTHTCKASQISVQSRHLQVFKVIYSCGLVYERGLLPGMAKSIMECKAIQHLLPKAGLKNSFNGVGRPSLSSYDDN